MKKNKNKEYRKKGYIGSGVKGDRNANKVQETAVITG